MDWRGRKYYIANFSCEAYDMRINILKNIEGIRLHCPPQNHNSQTKLSDELERRGCYHVLIGCKFEDSEFVEHELRKADRNDKYGCSWKEIKRDISKKYFDINGQEMPYRRCDINPNKRCNHCMDC